MRVPGWVGGLAALVCLAPGMGPAQAQQNARHTVLLLEFDGFGWNLKSDARNLLALGRRGVSAPEGMLPSYPASDAPNQLTIVTGLYPGQHGIVGQTFIDPARHRRYDASDPQSAADDSWYSGTPLWSLAESRGIRTACAGWLGCEAKIAGFKPTYLAGEKTSATPEAAERQILAWLRLPAAARPRFIAARFAQPGQAARRFGPDAPETRAAARAMDALVGRLVAGVKATGLDADLVVVSDAGVARPEGEWITLDQYADWSESASAGTFLYVKTEADRAHVYNLFKKATSEFFAYRLVNVPAELHFRNARAGDPVIVATGAYPLRVHGPAPGAPDAPPPRGVDGFDPRAVPAMKSIFFAAGPDIVEGTSVAPFENVNLYPWLAHLLGLRPPKNEGNLNILSGTLRDGGEQSAQ